MEQPPEAVEETPEGSTSVDEELDLDVRQEERELILDLISRYQIKGVKFASEIQKLLKAQGYDRTMRSIYRYRSILKRRMHKKLTQDNAMQESVESLAYKIKGTYDEISKEAWREYYRKEIIKIKAICPHCSKEHKIEARMPLSGAVRMKALAIVKDVAKDHVELMQSMGLAYKAPVKTGLAGSDGELIDPPASRDEMNVLFVQFVKSLYQTPATELVAEPKPPEAPKTP